MLANPLLLFAGQACWQSCNKTILSHSSHCFHWCQDEHNWLVRTDKTSWKEEYSTTGGWNPFLLQMLWLGNFVWNESRRSTSWLEPQAQMAALHEWSWVKKQSEPPLSTQTCYFADSMFSTGRHVLKENCFLYWMKIAFCLDWGSTVVLSSVF